MPDVSDFHMIDKYNMKNIFKNKTSLFYIESPKDFFPGVSRLQDLKFEAWCSCVD